MPIKALISSGKKKWILTQAEVLEVPVLTEGGTEGTDKPLVTGNMPVNPSYLFSR